VDGGWSIGKCGGLEDFQTEWGEKGICRTRSMDQTKAKCQHNTSKSGDGGGVRWVHGRLKKKKQKPKTTHYAIAGDHVAVGRKKGIQKRWRKPESRKKTTSTDCAKSDATLEKIVKVASPRGKVSVLGGLEQKLDPSKGAGKKITFLPQLPGSRKAISGIRSLY